MLGGVPLGGGNIVFGPSTVFSDSGSDDRTCVFHVQNHNMRPFQHGWAGGQQGARRCHSQLCQYTKQNGASCVHVVHYDQQQSVVKQFRRSIFGRLRQKLVFIKRMNSLHGHCICFSLLLRSLLAVWSSCQQFLRRHDKEPGFFENIWETQRGASRTRGPSCRWYWMRVVFFRDVI